MRNKGESITILPAPIDITAGTECSEPFEEPQLDEFTVTHVFRVIARSQEEADAFIESELQVLAQKALAFDQLVELQAVQRSKEEGLMHLPPINASGPVIGEA